VNQTKATDDHELGTWVYCLQHLRPHETGWCTVSLYDKVGLGDFDGNRDSQREQAYEKCKHLGLLVR